MIKKYPKIIMSVFAGKHVLIIVENLSLPFDRRVWQEANSLKDAGADVSIICPKMKGYEKKYEILNGIEIYRHPLPVEGRGASGYLIEYFCALFFESWLSMKIFFKKRFQVIQGCNPPDLIFLVALPFKLFGVKYVFDHHDINPELYIAKYNKKDFFYRLMLLFERWSFRTAVYSIATNESYREIALKRGGMKDDRITVVRSGADLDRIKFQKPNPDLKKGKKYLIGYVGVIGEQEGLDLLMDSIRYMKSVRSDFRFAIVGGGTDLEKIKQYARDTGVTNVVDFYGRVDEATLMEVLNSCEVCVNPDKPTEMNNLSTMNKIIEYMALKKPIVQYDLKEGKYSAGKASLYAENTDTKDFGDKIMYLLDHEAQRREMGEYGYKRVLEELSWDRQRIKLEEHYKKVFGISG